MGERPRLQAHVNTYADRRANAVAIVSPDPLIAALLGAAIELVGYRAEFPRADESAIDGLRRLRPAYMLMDAADPSAGDETLLGRCMMSDTRIFIFGSESGTDQFREAVATYGAQLIVFPRDIDALPQMLTRRSPPKRARTAEPSDE